MYSVALSTLYIQCLYATLYWDNSIAPVKLWMRGWRNVVLSYSYRCVFMHMYNSGWYYVSSNVTSRALLCSHSQVCNVNFLAHMYAWHFTTYFSLMRHMLWGIFMAWETTVQCVYMWERGRKWAASAYMFCSISCTVLLSVSEHIQMVFSLLPFLSVSPGSLFT